LLQQQTGRRVINLSMDGASNNWIARRVAHIQKEINPTNIVVMWSYIHRREREDCNVDDEKRRIHTIDSSEFEDIVNFKNCIDMVKNNHIFQLAIPEYSTTINFQHIWNAIRGPAWPVLVPTTMNELISLPNFIQIELKEDFKLWTKLQTHAEHSVLDNNIVLVGRLDLARDGHHFDLITAQWIVDQITPHLNGVNCL
jgi:hypothetical protein